MKETKTQHSQGFMPIQEVNPEVQLPLRNDLVGENGLKAYSNESVPIPTYENINQKVDLEQKSPEFLLSGHDNILPALFDGEMIHPDGTFTQ